MEMNSNDGRNGTEEKASIQVSVRIRPLSKPESALLQPDPSMHSFFPDQTNSFVSSKSKFRKIVIPLDDAMLVFDPPPDVQNSSSSIARPVMNRKKHKDIRYTFDRVFDEYASQELVFQHTTKPLVQEVLNGYNATVFAYGTGFFMR